MSARLELTRTDILAFRRRVGALDRRLPPGAASLRTAAWAGLQDSMPRAALLSLHARVEGTGPAVLDDPSLVQLWGPRFSAYAVAERDRGVFTVGRLPDGGARRRLAEELAARLHDELDGRRMHYGDAGRALGVNHNQLRYAAPTGTIVMRWDGARQPVIWTVPAPEIGDREARLELARRYLHVLGPSTADAFSDWAGIKTPVAAATFEALADETVPVSTPIGDARILADDEEMIREPPGPAAPARLLPSGDAYYLRWGEERELLVPDPDHRRALWTSRVWPGAVLVDGAIVGTWRRARHRVTVQPWRRLSGAAKEAVASEAACLPLPDLDRAIEVRWDG
jgi:hypothetical protein